MILYDYWRSSSAWRVRIALALKGLTVTHKHVNLIGGGGGGDQRAAAFRDKNPLAQVPVLELDDGRHITQSMAILEYLEERHPTPALLPADPWLRARARQLAEMVNSGIQPMQNLSLLQHVEKTFRAERDPWVRHFVGPGMAALEHVARETAGKFLVGDAPTFADLYLVPQMYSARRFGVDLGPCKTLVRVEEACAALPAFQRAHADVQPDAPPRPPGGGPAGGGPRR